MRFVYQNHFISTRNRATVDLIAHAIWFENCFYSNQLYVKGKVSSICNYFITTISCLVILDSSYAHTGHSYSDSSHAACMSMASVWLSRDFLTCCYIEFIGCNYIELQSHSRVSPHYTRLAVESVHVLCVYMQVCETAVEVGELICFSYHLLNLFFICIYV